MIKQTGCEFEPQTIRAVKSGFAGEEISAHLKCCAGCRETAKVVAFFQTNFVKETSPETLPAAGFLWWKSKIIEKRRREERVAQPILLAQIAAAAVFFATFLWFLVSQSAPSASLDSTFGRAVASIQVFIVPLAAAAICFAFICLLFVLALRHYFSEK